MHIIFKAHYQQILCRSTFACLKRRRKLLERINRVRKNTSTQVDFVEKTWNEMERNFVNTKERSGRKQKDAQANMHTPNNKEHALNEK